MASSTDALQRALNAWGLYTQVYERYALLHESLASANPEVREYFLGSLERYIQQERARMLVQHWPDILDVTPAQAEEVTVAPKTMMRLSGIVGHYGIHRSFLFLYVHAYLWDKIVGTGPLAVLDDLIDELDPR